MFFATSAARCGLFTAPETIDATDPVAVPGWGLARACGVCGPRAGADAGPVGSAALIPDHAGLFAANCCGTALGCGDGPPTAPAAVAALARGIVDPAEALTGGIAGVSGVA